SALPVTSIEREAPAVSGAKAQLTATESAAGSIVHAGSLTASIVNGASPMNATASDALPTSALDELVTSNVKVAVDPESAGFGETAAVTDRSARPAAVTRSSRLAEDDDSASAAVIRAVWVPAAASIAGVPAIVPLAGSIARPCGSPVAEKEMESPSGSLTRSRSGSSKGTPSLALCAGKRSKRGASFTGVTVIVSVTRLLVGFASLTLASTLSVQWKSRSGTTTRPPFESAKSASPLGGVSTTVSELGSSSRASSSCGVISSGVSSAVPRGGGGYGSTGGSSIATTVSEY